MSPIDRAGTLSGTNFTLGSFEKRPSKHGVSLQLNGMLMIWKMQQTMKDNAEFIRRIHPGSRAEVFIWQNFQPPYRDPGWKNRDLGNRASPPSHMNTSKILQRIQR